MLIFVLLFVESNGSSDVFTALVYATNLIFRPGVSKTFILLLCSDCRQSSMKVRNNLFNIVLFE